MSSKFFSLPGRSPIDPQGFTFHCHSEVPCFQTCCRDVDMLLFPYDIVRLKQCRQMHSSDFLKKHTRLCEGSHPFFPGLKLLLAEEDDHPCPFLGVDGCTVYQHRPSACRTYPLERGVEQTGEGSPLRIHYFMTRHPYCLGHEQKHTYTIKQWEREQGLDEYNYYNDLWAEVDAFFSTNPWAGEGKAGPYQQLAFMVCYNIDSFRVYVEQNRLVQQFDFSKDERRRISRDDAHLLRFGFQWIMHVLGRKTNLVKK
ncbi:YkgJ family cysteine cluster protein [Desulfobulbus alkaliphilus]|nr:YkgJ family cysteine cluster protein [Desulfobulbus alkaliphilus]